MGVIQDSLGLQAKANELLEKIATMLQQNQHTLDGDYVVWKRLPSGLLGYDARVVAKPGEFREDYLKRVGLMAEGLEDICKRQTSLNAHLQFKKLRRSHATDEPNEE